MWITKLLLHKNPFGSLDNIFKSFLYFTWFLLLILSLAQVTKECLGSQLETASPKGCILHVYILKFFSLIPLLNQYVFNTYYVSRAKQR